MTPVIRAGRLIFFGFYAGPRLHMNWAMIDTRTSINPTPLVLSDGSATNTATSPTKFPAGTQRQFALEDPALDNSKGNGSCLSGDTSDTESGRDHCDCGEETKYDEGLTSTSSDEVVDLGELADRVADALVGTNDRSHDGQRAEIEQATLLSTTMPLGRITGTQCMRGHRDSKRNVEDQRDAVSNSEGVRLILNAALTDDGSNTTGMQAAEQGGGLEATALKSGTTGEIPAEIEGELCGTGEFRDTCGPGEECCDNSRGTCAPKSQSCVQFGTSYGAAASSRQRRFRRLEVLIMSVGKKPSVPPKDRLRDLQLQLPELFAHVSLKGFKRLISQVTRRDSETSRNPHAAAIPALRRRPANVESLSAGSPAENQDRFHTQRAAINTRVGEQVPNKTLVSNRIRLQQQQQQQQPRRGGVESEEQILGGRREISAESLHLNLRSQEQEHVGAGAAAVEVNSPARELSFPGSRSLRKPGTAAREGATRRAATMEADDLSNDKGEAKTSASTAIAGGPPRHDGVDDSSAEILLSLGTDPTHAQRAVVDPGSMVGEREMSTSSFSVEDGDLLEGGNSVWDVGLPLTGLADIDIPSAMNGLLEREISEVMREESDRLGSERAAVIQATMGLLWKGYSDYAWGYDEVKPLGKRGDNNWGGMGVTLVDSLDTLWLMGLTQEFYDGRDWVRDHMTFENAGMVSVFETTIRVLGGLLSAFELSRDKAFLERAKELAERMMPAFATSTGIPFKMVDLSTGQTGGGSTSVLSELGTLQLEFRYLSRELGDDRYANKAMRAFDFLAGRTVPHGLYPIRINPNTGKFTSSKVSFGALGDSFYEYLLKVWMQGGRREDSYRRMYDTAMDGVDELLVQKARGLTYLSEWNGTTQQHRMDHLACFMAGNLALGSMTSKDASRAARDLKTGKALAYTCYQMYLRTATGLSPETVEFNGRGDMRARDKARFYILRPETLESFFVLHQLTGDPVYREWGWDIFRAIERHCRIGVAYGSHPDVENPAREAQDHMESFFPGETLKYLYLLMQPDHSIDLMEYTFNTEAHPLKIFSFDDARSSKILA